MSIPMLTDADIRRAWSRGHALHPGDCNSCGSQEFRTWQGVSVCSYCRSTAASAPGHTPSGTGLSAFGRNLTVSRYAEYMEALARIATA